MIEQVKINSISLNAENPRNITDAKFKKLVKSVKQFPEMLKLRPIIVNDQNIIIGGNMRYRACLEAGYKDIYIIKAKHLTKKQEKEFIVKDNVAYGDWDWDLLANDWEMDELNDWSVSVPQRLEDDESIYTKKIDAPIYTPSKEKPKIKDLINKEKTNELINNIRSSKLPKEEKDFLINAAQRHLVFDYSKIADYYAHSEKNVQNLMEESALVIIDFDKALRNGYVKLQEEIYNEYMNNE
jgi:hypothetical protein|tara:strand:+ start:246 stop:965 length:720 start_codon:yes stop_codon:yes gene_type:complete